MIRVAQVLRPAEGGIRRHVSCLLAHLDRSVFAQTLFAPPSFEVDSEQASSDRFNIAIGASPVRDLAAIFALARRLRGRFELVHAHGLRAAVVAVPAARLAGIPVIVTAHNLVPAGGGTKFVLRLLGKSASLVAVSRAVALSITARGVPPERIAVISNGIDLARLRTRKPDEVCRRNLLAEMTEGAQARGYRAVNPGWLRDPRNLVQPLFVVVGLGRLSHEKGFDILLEATSMPEAFHPGSTGFSMPLVVLAGGGPEQQALHSLAERRAQNTWMLGRVADPVPLLTVADVVAVPSREEGQGLAALEAMGAGKPVVASNVGGLVETVVDGVTGILIAPNDPASLAGALGRLEWEPEMREQMGIGGRARAEERYSLEAMVGKISALYSEMAIGHASAGAG